jgi:hypothetical protein
LLISKESLLFYKAVGEGWLLFDWILEKKCWNASMWTWETRVMLFSTSGNDSCDIFFRFIYSPCF